MSNIRVQCIDQAIGFLNTPVISSGNVNYDTITFEFCSRWDGFRKTAIFYRTKDDVYYQILDESDTCKIPNEVLGDTGVIYIGVFGVKEDITITSEILTYRIREGAITEGLKPSDPTPDIYDQIISKYDDYDQRLAYFENLFNGSIGNAEKLGGQLPEYYATAESVANLEESISESLADIEDGTKTVGNASKLNNKEESKLSVGNADTLGGKRESELSVKNADTVNGKHEEELSVANADTLDGKHASDFLTLTGGTLTGNIVIKRETPVIIYNDLPTGSGAKLYQYGNTLNIQNENVAGDANNRRFLRISNTNGVPAIADALTFYDVVNSITTAYQVFHAGNSQKVTITADKNTPPAEMSGLWAY